MKVAEAKSTPHIVSGNHLSMEVKKYCKYHRLKFEKNTKDGFIASQLINIKAGMEYSLSCGKITSLPNPSN